MKMSSDELPGLHRRHRAFGSVLVQAGRLAEADVRKVLQAQVEGDLRFGEVALSMGLITEEDVRFALSSQFEQYPKESAASARLDLSLVAAHQPFSSEAEPFRAIRSQLLLRWLTKVEGRNVLAVVSERRGDGRSHLAANLAIMFSQAGEQTLLIDADLREPSLHKLFEIENRQGLSSLVAGHTAFSPTARLKALPGLCVMPSGPVPPNPLELLCRPAWGDVIEDARASFDVVIVDTPALESGDDALFSASQAGAALLVARNNHTRFAAFNDLARGLVNSGIEVVGSVLNDLPMAGER